MKKESELILRTYLIFPYFTKETDFPMLRPSVSAELNA